jgi:hypothetical protein
MRADPGVGADADGTENAATGAKHHAVSNGGVALGALAVRPPSMGAECHAVVDHHVVADLGGLADDHTHAVVDEQPPADTGTRMDFDAGDQARRLRHHPGQQRNIPAPQFMRETVRPDSPQSLVQDDLAGATPAQRGILAIGAL